MAKYRAQLPQCNGGIFMTDGGLETTLIFREAISLPEFAAFILLETGDGMQKLRSYYITYAELARRFRIGLILDSATWRANSDWGTKLDYNDTRLNDVNRRAIGLLEEVRNAYETEASKMVISGSIGPRGDGYVPSTVMSVDEAAAYHGKQMKVFADSQADMVTAYTMNYIQEALGITTAAKQIGMPVVISFTVETDGKLPTGDSLQEAIERVDAQTGSYPLYYMINCAHPTHFMQLLTTPGDWLTRIHGVRANASSKSHAELNEATELDDGNPLELAQQYQAVKSRLPSLHVIGGCCGTDDRHVEALCKVFAG